MNYLLLVITISILFWIIVENGNDFVSPSFLFTAPLTLSIFIAVIYQDIWGFECEVEPFFLPTLGIIMFWFGDIAGRKMVKRNPSAYMNDICDMSIGRFRTFVILETALCMLLLVYKEVVDYYTYPEGCLVITFLKYPHTTLPYGTWRYV